MSVVIVGGHDRMVCQYKKICKEHNCKAKVFTQMPAKLGNQIGSPDLIILFTNTVSHKTVCGGRGGALQCGCGEKPYQQRKCTYRDSGEGLRINKRDCRMTADSQKILAGPVGQAGIFLMRKITQ